MGSWLDIVILITALVGGYMGWRLGGVRIMAMGLGAGAGALVAGRYYQEFAFHLSGAVSDKEAAQIISFAALAGGVFIGTLLLGLMVRRTLRLFFLGWLDGASGVLMGVSLAAAMWFLALGYSTPFMPGELKEAVTHSRATHLMLKEIPRATGLLPEPVRELVGSTRERLEAVNQEAVSEENQEV